MSGHMYCCQAGMRHRSGRDLPEKVDILLAMQETALLVCNHKPQQAKTSRTSKACRERKQSERAFQQGIRS